MKLIILALTILVIVGCNKPLDPVSYLACEQDYQKADKIYVMTDADKDFKELRDICEDCKFKWDVKIV